MIALVTLLAAQLALSADMHEKLEGLKPIVAGVQKAIETQDDVALQGWVAPETVLIDADGNKFPFRVATFKHLADDCKFVTMSFDLHALYDDGTIWWNCPQGQQRLYLAIRDGKVFEASPFKNPAIELPEALAKNMVKAN